MSRIGSRSTGSRLEAPEEEAIAAPAPAPAAAPEPPRLSKEAAAFVEDATALMRVETPGTELEPYSDPIVAPLANFTVGGDGVRPTGFAAVVDARAPFPSRIVPSRLFHGVSVYPITSAPKRVASLAALKQRDLTCTAIRKCLARIAREGARTPPSLSMVDPKTGADGRRWVPQLSPGDWAGLYLGANVPFGDAVAAPGFIVVFAGAGPAVDAEFAAFTARARGSIEAVGARSPQARAYRAIAERARDRIAMEIARSLNARIRNGVDGAAFEGADGERIDASALGEGLVSEGRPSPAELALRGMTTRQGALRARRSVRYAAIRNLHPDEIVGRPVQSTLAGSIEPVHSGCGARVTHYAVLSDAALLPRDPTRIAYVAHGRGRTLDEAHVDDVRGVNVAKALGLYAPVVPVGPGYAPDGSGPLGADEDSAAQGIAEQAIALPGGGAAPALPTRAPARVLASVFGGKRAVSISPISVVRVDAVA